MAVRRVSMIAIGAAALAWSGLSVAQQYRPDEFLSLDLSRAVLSPTPLGPAGTFKPGPLDVSVDRESNAARANAELLIEPKTVPAATFHAGHKSATSTVLKRAASGPRVAHARVERAAPPHSPHSPRALVALHGRNPMDAQARDTSIQVWPCKSGGICNWRR